MTTAIDSSTHCRRIAAKERSGAAIGLTRAAAVAACAVLISVGCHTADQAGTVLTPEQLLEQRIRAWEHAAPVHLSAVRGSVTSHCTAPAAADVFLNDDKRWSGSLTMGTLVDVVEPHPLLAAAAVPGAVFVEIGDAGGLSDSTPALYWASVMSDTTSFRCDDVSLAGALFVVQETTTADLRVIEESALRQRMAAAVEDAGLIPIEDSALTIDCDPDVTNGVCCERFQNPGSCAPD